MSIKISTQSDAKDGLMGVSMDSFITDFDGNSSLASDINGALQRAMGSFQTDFVGNFSTGATFLSSAVMAADTLVTLGNVPNVYAGYQLLRTAQHHFNLHHDCSFDMSAGTHELIYAHVLFDSDHGTYQPDFLSAGSPPWTYTGNSGTCQVKDRDGVFETATVFYYSKDVSASFTWRWTISTIENQFDYFVGAFLIPPGVTISNINPEIYTIIPNISVAYTQPAIDALYWDKTPDTRPATTDTASNWLNIGTLVGNANDGDVIRAPSGILNDDGDLVLTNQHFDPENPLWIVGGAVTLSGATVPTTELRGETRIIMDNCSGIRWWGFLDTQGTTLDGDERFDIDNCEWVTVENFYWNSSNSDLEHDRWDYIQLSTSKYCKLSNNSIRDKQGRGNCVSILGSGANPNANQFHNIQNWYCKDWNAARSDWIDQNNSFFRFGGNTAFDSRLHTLVRRMKFENYNRVQDDSEWMVIKGCGVLLSQCIHIGHTDPQGSQGFFPRVGAWTVGIGLASFCKSNSANNQGFHLNGIKRDQGFGAEYHSSNHCYARNYVQDWDGPNCYLALNAINSTNRDHSEDNIIGELYMHGTVDAALAFENIGANPTAAQTPSNCFMWGIAIKSTSNIIDDDYDPTDSTTFEACMMDGSSLGTPPIAGISENDPNLFDRGDGIFVSDEPGLQPAVKKCVCVSLQGDNIADLGPTYDNI